MERVEQIRSPCGRIVIEVVQASDGSFTLRKFVIKYDQEEDESYKIREYPDPIGRFGDFDSAVKEAKRIVKL